MLPTTHQVSTSVESLYLRTGIGRWDFRNIPKHHFDLNTILHLLIQSESITIYSYWFGQVPE